MGQEMIMVVIGSTGTGKSTLCNVLAGRDPEDNLFPVSEAVSACTFETTSKTVNSDGYAICLVDTPGFDDPSGKDTKNIRDMVAKLKGLGHVNVLLIVLNGQAPRLDRATITMLLIFREMFGESFLKNTVFEFSKWSYDTSSKKRREKTKMSEEHWLRQINYKLKALKLLSEESNNVPGVFIDSLHDTTDEFESTIFKRQKDKLLALLQEKEALPCKNFAAVPIEIDRIKAKVEELEQQIVIEQEKKRKAEEEARQEQERRQAAEVARRQADERAKQERLRADKEAAERVRAQQLAAQQRIAAERRAAELQLAHEKALRDAIPQYGPWEEKKYINTGVFFHNEKPNWGFAVKWKRKRWGWIVASHHGCAGEETQMDSPLSPQQIVAEARVHIAAHLAVGLDQIREDVLFPGFGVGDPCPIGYRWRHVYDQYVLTYFFRVKNR